VVLDDTDSYGLWSVVASHSNYENLTAMPFIPSIFGRQDLETAFGSSILLIFLNYSVVLLYTVRIAYLAQSVLYHYKYTIDLCIDRDRDLQ
jgi:hypothetical protein